MNISFGNPRFFAPLFYQGRVTLVRRFALSDILPQLSNRIAAVAARAP